MYLGQPPFQEYSRIPTKDNFTGDGSTTAFDLSAECVTGSENALEVFVNNVRQEPGSGKAFTLGLDGSSSLRRVTFTAAPANGAAIYVINDRQYTTALVSLTDMNGTELILDVDGDTSITADTDDRIDIKVSGTDQIQIVDGAVKPVTDSDVDLGTSSLYFKNAYIDTVTTTGNVTVGGDLAITGATSFGDANITNVGSIALDTITNDGTDITLDSSGDIILDAGGDTIFLKDSGTTFGSLDNTSGNLIIKSGTTTAATFAGANVTLAGTVGSGAITSTGVVTGTGFTIGSAVINEAELETIDGITAGTVAASKAVVVDSNKDIGTFRNLTIDGVFTDGNYTFDTSGNVSGLGTVGSGAITSSGIVTGTGFTAGSAVLAEAELELLDGLTAGTAIASKVVTTDSNIDSTGMRNLTISGELDAATLDISGNADIDGTLEADAITVDGSTLASVIAGTTVNLATLATTVTITDNENTNENNAVIFTAGGDVDGGNLGLESDGDLTYNPSTGTLNVPNISVTGTQTIVNSVTMNASNAVIFEGATADAYETTLTTVDATADRTISLPNVAGTLPVLAAASATAITTTPAEINLIDGGTARGTTTVVSGDGLLVNDGGVMRMTNVDTVSTYFSAHNVGGGNIVTTGALDSGSITSGFGTINNGSSTITTTGAITGGSLVADNITIDGTEIDLSSGSLTLDVAGDIVLDSGDGAWEFLEAGTEKFRLFASSNDVYMRAATSDKDIYFQGNDGGSNITMLRLDSSEAGTAVFNHDILLGDNGKAIFGAGSDLQIYHDGSNSIIKDAGTGNIVIQADDFKVMNAAGNENIIFAAEDGLVRLFHNNVTKFETTANGITVTGTAIATTDTDTSNSGSITLNFTTNQNFVLTLTGNVTLANPSTEQVGQSGFIAFIQDGTGSRTVSLGTDYETAAGAGLTLTSTASATDLVPYLVVASNRILLGTPQLAFS